MSFLKMFLASSYIYLLRSIIDEMTFSRFENVTRNTMEIGQGLELTRIDFSPHLYNWSFQGGALGSVLPAGMLSFSSVVTSSCKHAFIAIYFVMWFGWFMCFARLDVYCIVKWITMDARARLRAP